MERFFLTFHSFLRKKTMADAANKYAENVTGQILRDDQCIDCDLCRETAPANFKRTMTAAIPTFINSQRRLKKKDLQRSDKAVRSKRSATNGNGA